MVNRDAHDLTANAVTIDCCRRIVSLGSESENRMGSLGRIRFSRVHDPKRVAMRPGVSRMNRLTFAIMIFTLTLAISACSYHGTSPDTSDTEEPEGMVLSNPVSAVSVATQTGIRQSVSSSSAGTSAFVSIAPGTYPDAFVAEIRNRSRGGVQTTVVMTDGGFDPVAIAAQEGDVLRLTIWTSSGDPTLLTLKVPSRRPPTVVRSNPPKGRVDVALNQYLVAVFSEPIDPTSVTQASVRVEHNGQQVSGTVLFHDNSWTAEFIPAVPFEPQSEYQLVITDGVRDLDGDRLAGSYTAPFSTGTTECPGYAIPSSCPPFPTGGNASISGVVNERTPEGIRPLANATAFAWVELSDHGYSAGGVRTDSDGRFTIRNLPFAQILLQGGSAGFTQPCARVVNLGSLSDTATIELVAQNRPILETATEPPVVKGVVYETTPQGRQPVGGALIMVDQLGGDGLVSATTTTNEKGEYAVCRVPTTIGSPWIFALKDGYSTTGQAISFGNQSELTLDIEMKR
jgi:hypothetical protein